MGCRYSSISKGLYQQCFVQLYKWEWRTYENPLHQEVCKGATYPNRRTRYVGPVFDTLLYPKGNHLYAVDFERFNNQNGIALELDTRTMATCYKEWTPTPYSQPSGQQQLPMTARKIQNSKSQTFTSYPPIKVIGTATCWRQSLAATFTIGMRNLTVVNGYIRIHVN